MDRQNIASENILGVKKSENNNKNRVDINILLNRVRKNQKKEKYGKFFIAGMISLAVIATGFIVSL